MQQQKETPHFVPKATVSVGEGGAMGTPQRSTYIGFINNLPIPITVVDRQGIRTGFTANRGQFSGDFILRRSEKFQPTVNLDLGDLLNDCGDMPSELSVQILGMLKQQPDVSRTLTRRMIDFTIDFTITMEDLRRNGGSVYVPWLDVVVSTASIQAAPAHPESMVVKRQQLLGSGYLNAPQSGMHYQVKIVDRAGVFGDRYVNINGDVFRVPVVSQSSYQDGVYLISTHPSPTGEQFTYPRADYYRFDVADKRLGLYRTAVDAETLGDPQTAYKRELDGRSHQLKLDEHEMRKEKGRLEHEAALRQASLTRDKEEYERRKMAWDSEVKMRETQLELAEQAWKEREHHMKQEAALLKDKLESSSNTRKVVLEVVKFGPTIAVGVWAIVKAVKKLSETKS